MHALLIMWTLLSDGFHHTNRIRNYFCTPNTAYLSREIIPPTSFIKHNKNA